MRTAALSKIPPIIKPIVPDRDPMTGKPFKVTGIHEPTGERIFLSHELDFEAMKESRRPAVGPDGEPVLREGNHGHKYPVMKQDVIWKEVEFVLRPHPQGHVMKVRNFRASEQDRLREEHRVRKEGFIDSFVDAAMERGMDPDDLLDSILAARESGALVQDPEFVEELASLEDLPDAVDVAAEDIPDDEVKSLMVHEGFGKWKLTDGTVVEGTEDALEAQRKLLAEAARNPDGPEF